MTAKQEMIQKIAQAGSSNDIIEALAVYIERDSQCFMKIVVPETKHDYGVRLLGVMADEIRGFKIG